MQYFGGKYAISKPLSAFLNSLLTPGQAFVDAFCGSCNVVSRINPNRRRIANDLHTELMALWEHVLSGRELPDVVSEELYQTLRYIGEPWEKAFAGFGCSFGGKYWGGYARETPGNLDYCGRARRALREKASTMQCVELHCGSYDEIPIPEGALVYCDIPYRGTKGYSVGAFDHDRFYEWASRVPNVYVSEYARSIPAGWRAVWSIESYQSIRGADSKRAKTLEVLITKE
jgi:DNA adenine methylase